MYRRILFPVVLGGACLLARGAAAGPPARPTIMVIPWAAAGEDLRTVLEQDVHRRIAVTTLKEAFDRHGYRTIDFVARLRAVADSRAFTTDSLSDVKSQIVQSSGAEVFVQAEVHVERESSGTAATVVMTAYETATGNSLASATGFSGRFYTDDVGRLVQRAVDKVSDEFLSALADRFGAMQDEGRSIALEIRVGPSSLLDLASPAGPDQTRLSDLVEDWVSRNARDGTYHLQGATSKGLLFDEVKIPLRTTDGSLYTPTRFASDLSRFLASQSVQADRDVKGNTVYITLR
ncbi:MAG TPA: DUF6175 family protein [Thermoanaerobaculia bacterium]|nr:DUF6175 family protein [Thermoanaerobaculia bacterium]